MLPRTREAHAAASRVLEVEILPSLWPPFRPADASVPMILALPPPGSPLPASDQLNQGTPSRLGTLRNWCCSSPAPSSHHHQTRHPSAIMSPVPTSENNANPLPEMPAGDPMQAQQPPASVSQLPNEALQLAAKVRGGCVWHAPASPRC